MPQKYRNAYDEYVATVIGNRTRQRWEECIDRMQPVLGMPLGLLFVDEAFDEGSKEKVGEVKNFMFNLSYLFQLFAQPICAINVAEGK